MKSLLSALAVVAVLPAVVLAQAAGPEFQVNTYTTGSQYAAQVASDENGNFVVVWTSDGQDGSGFGVFGQRFNGAGVAQGGEFQVNTYTTGKQYFPAVASDPSGNFVVVWQDQAGEDGYGYGIFGRRFDATGAPQGAEFGVNSYTTFNQSRPAVSRDAIGNFVVVWISDFQDGNATGIFGQRFDAAGVPQGGEFRVNSYTPGFQFYPAVASDHDGNFLVVWSGPSPLDGSQDGVLGQRYDAAGVAQGGEFRINSSTSGAQFLPKVTADASGNFVVAWAGVEDSFYPGIFAQRLDGSGVLLGPELHVNTYTTSVQSRPSVAADADGNFTVVWHGFVEDGSSYGIFGQSFDPSGAPRGGEFLVNTYTTGEQLTPRIAMDKDGDFVVVWNEGSQDGSTGIFGQRYGDLIFQDGFDSGSLFRWSSAQTDGADLKVTAAAALAGTGMGLRARVNDTNSIFVEDDTPSGEGRYRARFYFDTNAFDPGETTGHFRTRIFIGQGGGVRLVTIVLKRQLGAYSLEARVRRNDGTRADTGFFGISDGSHLVEFDWQRSAPGASDGALELWIDNASVATLAGIDNDLNGVDEARMGAIAVKPGAAGTLFFDQFESRRQAFIGPE